MFTIAMIVAERKKDSYLRVCITKVNDWYFCTAVIICNQYYLSTCWSASTMFEEYFEWNFTLFSKIRLLEV